MILRMWRGRVHTEKVDEYVDDIEAARYYPEDEGYLVDREMTVRHFRAETQPISPQ